MHFPENRLEQHQILEQLTAMKSNDLDWATGKVMAYVYQTDAEAKKLAEAAYLSYLTENGLDPSSFPSLLQLEREVIAMLAQLLNAGSEAAGNCTSGGTESVMLAVKTARDYARKEKGIAHPEIIVPETAHPCFHKAGHYLDVKVNVIPVDKVSFKANVEAMAAAINENTILLVGSAPSYAHGVIDPIEEIAALATSKGILCHVDACVGGMYLPFAKMLGADLPAFDFSVEGVSSMSCDLHKFGYVPKGCSTIIYRNKELRQYQLYACSDWPGYTIVNPTVLSSKTGGPMAAAWAMFNYFGIEGYKKAVEACESATQLLLKGIEEIPELEVLGEPVMSLIAIRSKEESLAVFELAETMKEHGFYIQVQLASNASVEALHITISHFNCEHVPEMIEAFKKSVAFLKSDKAPNMEMLAGLDASMIKLLLDEFTPDMLDNMEALLGIDSTGGIPDNFALINSILNGLEPAQRDMLLTAFVNRMFTQPA